MRPQSCTVRIGIFPIALYSVLNIPKLEILETIRGEDFDIEYNSNNAFRFMGNGLTDREASFEFLGVGSPTREEIQAKNEDIAFSLPEFFQLEDLGLILRMEWYSFFDWHEHLEAEENRNKLVLACSNEAFALIVLQLIQPVISDPWSSISSISLFFGGFDCSLFLDSYPSLRPIYWQCYLLSVTR